MVETALNLVWLAIAVTALVAVPVRTRNARIALICALALLFPIISISDDLSADRETLDRVVAVLTELLVLLAMFVQLGQLDPRRERRRASVLLVSSDPRSPPRA